MPAVLFGPYVPERLDSRRLAPEYAGAVRLAHFGPMVLGALHALQVHLMDDLSSFSRLSRPKRGLRNVVILGDLAYAVVIAFLCSFLQSTYSTISQQQVLVACLAVCRGLSIYALRIVFSRIHLWPTCSALLECFA